MIRRPSTAVYGFSIETQKKRASELEQESPQSTARRKWPIKKNVPCVPRFEKWGWEIKHSIQSYRNQEIIRVWKCLSSPRGGTRRKRTERSEHLADSSHLPRSGISERFSWKLLFLEMISSYHSATRLRSKAKKKEEKTLCWLDSIEARGKLERH